MVHMTVEVPNMLNQLTLNKYWKYWKFSDQVTVTLGCNFFDHVLCHIQLIYNNMRYYIYVHVDALWCVLHTIRNHDRRFKASKLPFAH